MNRHTRIALVGEYSPLHITNTATLAPVGRCISTTSNTAIVVGSNVVVTPASMENIRPGVILNFANGTGTAENVVVKSTTTTTFTADFVYGHSGAYTIISRRGISLGNVVVNNSGTNGVLTLYSGHPSLLPDAGGSIAIVALPPVVPLDYMCSCDKGLFYTLAGSGVDLTLMYMDHT